jgi:hypothetical protein
VISFGAGFKRFFSFRRPIIKGLLFGAAWYLFPAWLFILAAAYLYFVPFFQSSKFFPVFVAVMAIYGLAPASLAYALAGGILFGWLIAIRELLFIDRRFAHEVLIFALVFFLLRIVYVAQDTIGMNSFFWALFIAAMVAWMAKGFVDSCMADEAKKQKRPFAAIGIGLLGFFAWQVIMIGFVIPVDFVYQSLLAFLVTVGMFDLLSAHLLGYAARKKILLTATMVFSGLVILLAAAPFKL